MTARAVTVRHPQLSPGCAVPGVAEYAMTSADLAPTDPPRAATPASAAEARLDLVARLLDAALQAYRNGSFVDLARQRPLVLRWLLQRHERCMRGVLGQPAQAETAPALALCLLRWLVAQLRPDGAAQMDGLAEADWLYRTAWRPALAVAAVAGFVAVPDYPRHYRRRSGEPALENLCGLWGVGQSTVYRLMERARRQMAQTLLEGTREAQRSLSLRAAVKAELDLGLWGPGEAVTAAWHRERAGRAQRAGDAASALWHLAQAGDAAGFARSLRLQASDLAGSAETDPLVELVAAREAAPRVVVDLWLARAALARSRGAYDRELAAIEAARQAAQAAQEPLLLGIVLSALGKYFESRDVDRAVACYQDSAEFLRDTATQADDSDALEHQVTTYGRLAWMYLLRNDDRARGLLDRAEALRTQARVPDAVLGVLEQVWGEYWRRAGELARSLEHRHRALNIFERLGDRRSIFATYLNLSNTYALQKNFEQAQRYASRVLDEGVTEHELEINAHMSLGNAYFWQGRLDESIAAHGAALARSRHAGLRLHAFRAHYNLAEAYYNRFREQGQTSDEEAGDAHVRAALDTPDSDSSPAAKDAVRKLKAEVLGAAPPPSSPDQADRLLPAELAAHAELWAEVQRRRAVLAEPSAPEAHARAHLAIARAYAAIAAKERDAAMALIERHGLTAGFVAELDALRRSFERELTREQQLAAAWKPASAELFDDDRRAALIAHLLREGALTKSGYGQLAGVAPATASKHLGLLAERGLLVQRGKGPATRYELPG